VKHVSKRTPGKFDVLVKAKELAIYTIHITHNEKHFPKKYRFSIVKNLQDKAMYILDCLTMANELNPCGKDTFYPEIYERRKVYQKEAYAACRSLLTMIDIAVELFDIKVAGVSHWTALVVEVKNKTNAWISSDASRFNKGAD
jgi:hypothetical protein